MPTLRRLASLALIIATCLLIASPRPAPAAESPAGQVEAVAGQVTAAGADGAIRALGKNDPIYSGDIVSTGPNSRVRIVFSDKGVIFLRPSTRFVIKTYQHSGDPEKDTSKFSLIRGGFRSVTGAIGKSNTKNYKVDTPVATIGIRGTDHEGRFCAGDCADLADVGVAEPPDGLYTGTNSGQTEVGGQHFTQGQYGYTGLNGQTNRLPEPPPILVKDPLLPTALSDQGSSGGGTGGGAGGADGSGGGGGQQGAGGAGGAGGSDGAGGGGAGGGGGSPAGGGAAGGATEGEGMDIPAQPPTTHAVDCR